MYRDVVNNVNKRYVNISERMTKAYESRFGLKCELFFPIRPLYDDKNKYRDMKIFAPHQSYEYNSLPDAVTRFYIPHLIKKQAMNSSELEFDGFYTEEDAIDRPFIETCKRKELPIGTKVVVYQGQSIQKFTVDKKLVVTGANGFMLLRMYLDPLAKDSDKDNITEYTKESTNQDEENNSQCEEVEFLNSNEYENMDEFDNGVTMNIPDEDD